MKKSLIRLAASVVLSVALVAAISAGNVNGAVKSAATGWTARSGKSLRSPSACALRKSREISTGT